MTDAGDAGEAGGGAGHHAGPDAAGSGAVAGDGPPWWNLANLFTLLRVFLVPVIAVLLIFGGEDARWWAFGIFVFAALTDSIDGWVARKLIGPTRWGQLADPAADKALIVGSLAVLAYQGRLPWWAVGIIVVREVYVTVLRTRLARRDLVMPASIFGKAKTVSQVIAVTLYLWPGLSELLRAWVLIVAVAITVASGLEYVFRGRRLRAG